MSAFTSAYLQVSDEENVNRSDEMSYQMREYLNSGPTITERLYGFQQPKDDKKKGKKGKRSHKDKIQEQLDDFDRAMSRAK